MTLDKARKTLEQIEDIERRMDVLVGDGIDDQTDAPLVADGIGVRLGRLHRWARRWVCDLEREAFLSLCGEEKSQARMKSLLTTSKPLRN